MDNANHLAVQGLKRLLIIFFSIAHLIWRCGLVAFCLWGLCRCIDYIAKGVAVQGRIRVRV